MKPKIILIDIDGVLVKPGGYRLAMQETCRYFLVKGGIERYSPDAEIYSLFESQCVTSEWDVIPLSLLIVLDAIASVESFPNHLSNLIDALDWVLSRSIPNIEIPYQEIILDFGKYIHPGITAAQGILDAKLNGQGDKLFVHLDNCQLIQSLLGDTRNLSSELIRKFQEYVLGGEIFSKFFGENPEHWCTSYLLEHDTSNLLPEHQKTLKRFLRLRNLYASVYTARPSLPPRELDENFKNFSPEAEIALKLCGLEELPLIGYGKLGYLASKTGRTIPEYIKPAPVQALAGIAAALTGSEWLGLQWAARTADGIFPDNQEFQLPKEFKLYILEDSAAGIQGGHSAIQLLNQNGWEVEFHPMGISKHLEKIKSLENIGAVIYQDVNTALSAIFEETRV